MQQVGDLIDRVARAGALRQDSDEVRLRQVSLVLSALLMTALSTVWVTLYFVKGLTPSALIPLAYQVISLTSVLLFLRTKRFRLFRTSQLFMTLLLPAALQWSLGGFVPSSGVILWSFTAPLGALLFAGTKEAVPWFVAFVAITLALGIADPHLASKASMLGRPLIISLFVLNIAGVTLTCFLMLRYFVGQRERALVALDLEHRNLVQEQERSERLLLNVLPSTIAARLKTSSAVIADGFADVTVLFADIVNFTPLSDRVSPEQLVKLLDELFTDFDGLVERFNLEKIKTIGDAYMVAGGLPVERPDHAQAVADMALEMNKAVGRHGASAGDGFSLRIGMDTGPVVAGVIGRKKFIYDLWGDTVNTASRMESQGIPGRIHVTARTRDRLADAFELEMRGEIQVKGKGPMTTYFLLGRAR
ncbi:MAG: adenylate/guanylate cyclase domain-containing protein [Actinobacteria bacterium]|nr:MAG: adenylate/guanylate cyclase domain-containing protein [Actinomycetota bacterium]